MDRWIYATCGRMPEWHLGDPEKIVETITEHFGVGAGSLDESDLVTDIAETQDDEDEDAAVSRFVNEVVAKAVSDRATDIHFEPHREELQILLGGYMGIPKGTVEPGHPWWGNPSFDIRYDPDAARALMEEAGFSEDNPVQVKVQTSASGSGQMQPVTMNEYVQQSLSDCHFDAELDVIEWNTLFTNWRKGADDESARGAHAINVSFATMDPFFAMVRFTSTETFPPVSNNWGLFGNDEFDGLIADARTSFDDADRDAALAKLHTRLVEEAPFIWIAHDVGPRAMSSRVGNVTQPKSWFIDIATMTIED
jgi:ABC-type transport system substrate-binding protein